MFEVKTNLRFIITKEERIEMEQKLEKAQKILKDLERQVGRNDIYLIKLSVVSAKLRLK